MLDTWLQDVRYAIRLLGRNPILALTAAAALAIGIAATTTIFTIANALLLRPPLGVCEPGRIVDIGRSQNGQGFDTNSYPNYLDIRARNNVFSSVYAYNIEPQPMSLGGADWAERVFGHVVTLNYFATLGAQPLAGRLFSALRATCRRAARSASTRTKRYATNRRDYGCEALQGCGERRAKAPRHSAKRDGDSPWTA